MHSAVVNAETTAEAVVPGCGGLAAAVRRSASLPEWPIARSLWMCSNDPRQPRGWAAAAKKGAISRTPFHFNTHGMDACLCGASVFALMRITVRELWHAKLEARVQSR